MDDWEDEPVSIVIKDDKTKNMWDDEDADEDDIKDSWEDEDEPAPAPAPVAPPAKTVPKKSTAKATDKKGKTVEVEKGPPLDPLAEKLRQQRLVEEADYKSTAELFAKKGDEKTLDGFIPKSESDFLEYAELISYKCRPYEKSFHYIGLVKALVRMLMTDLKAENAKDVASTINAIVNEKLKAEKEANAGKKKTGAKKKQLNINKADDEAVVESYGGYDEYDDFM